MQEFFRNSYEDIIPGYYMNKTHWNSIKAEGNVPNDVVKELLDKSYDEIHNKLKITKSQKYPFICRLVDDIKT